VGRREVETGLQSERSHGAGHRLTERVTALHRRLRRQVGVDT
jgi:hypothetical protein